MQSACPLRAQEATSNASLELNKAATEAVPGDQTFKACAWLFPNEYMGLNLPFAVGLAFIQLHGTSGQHGRFLTFHQ